MSKDKKDTIIYFIFKVLMALIAVVSLSVYTKLILPEEYGKYSLIIGLIQIMISLFIGWIGSSGLRYYDEYKEKESSFCSTNIISWGRGGLCKQNSKSPFYSTIIISWVLVSAVVVLFLYVIGNFSSEVPIIQYYSYAILLTLSLGFINVFEKIIRAARETKFYVAIMLLQNIVNLISLLFIISWNNRSAAAIMTANIISQYLTIVIIFFRLRLFKNIKLQDFSNEVNMKFLRYGIPMVGVWGISWILSYSDRFFIKYFYSYYEVGIYDIAYKVTEQSIGIISASFTLSVFPVLITTWNKEGEAGVQKKLSVIWRYFLMLLIPASFGLMAVSQNIYGIVIDKKYISGSIIIQISCLAFVFTGVNDILNKIWQIKEKTKNILLVMVISVLINVAGNILLLPRYGYQAAAWTTLAAYASGTVITAIFVRKEIKINIQLKMVAQIVLSTFAMYSFLIAARIYIKNIASLLLIIIIASVIYFAVLLTVGGMNDVKTSFIKRFKR